MSARVFISCSQNKENTEETAAVELIKNRLQSKLGLDVTVAVDENHWNGNLTIIETLKVCDYFLFIDFERVVSENKEESFFSVYSHQELAMAMALGFDSTNMLVFHKRGMVKVGLLANIFSNAEFDGYSDVPVVVKQNVEKAGWKSTYSRKLVALPCELKKEVDHWRDIYSLPRVDVKHSLEQRRDLSRELRRERIALIPIQNRRKDIAAINCVVHLKDIEGECDFIDRAPIKAAGLNGFSHTIWPGEIVYFDLFGYDVEKKWIFMHTECDVTTSEGCRKPIISKPGTYVLTYEIYAEHFPVSTFQIELSLGNEINGGIEISLYPQKDIPEQFSIHTTLKTSKYTGLINLDEGCGTGMI